MAKLSRWQVTSVSCTGSCSDAWGLRVVWECGMAGGSEVAGPGSPGLLALASLNCTSLLGFLLNPKFPEKVEGRFTTAPLVDLSLSPPSGLDSPNGSSSLSPERQGNGDLPTVPTAPVRRGCGFWRQKVYWFPGAIVTKDHKLGGLKQQKYIIFSLF